MSVEVPGHGILGHQGLVVGKADVRFSGERPVNEIFVGALFAVFGKAVEVRRVVGTEQFAVAQKNQATLGGFNRVGDVAPRFGFLFQAYDQIRALSAIGVNFDAGIFVLKGFDQFLVRVAGQRGIPNDPCFALGAGVKQLFAVGAAVESTSSAMVEGFLVWHQAP